jgi:hypothetical protein
MTQDTSSYTAVATISPFLLTLLTTPGSAALRIKNSELPSAIQVDENAHHEVARRLGAGVQVYDRDPAKGTFTFREPQAGALCLMRYQSPTPSFDLCERIRGNQSVLIVPGAHLGLEGFIRVWLGGRPEFLREGLRRIGIELQAEIGRLNA